MQMENEEKYDTCDLCCLFSQEIRQNVFAAKWCFWFSVNTECKLEEVMWNLNGGVRYQEFQCHLCWSAVSSKAQFTEVGHCAKQNIFLNAFTRFCLCGTFIKNTKHGMKTKQKLSLNYCS